ncbi:MAG TPA: winged helix-turn-helix domain-containing protein [Candidatus Rubrimentiphilum sp.]|nr:winged helix-turn-helix domain-containing protein [Candidatus Rubrimentiphilum sp.]
MSIYSFGPFCLDPERLLLTLAGEPVALGPKVVETLLALIERPGETLTKNELLDRIWPEGFIEESSLAQNIYVIRKVLRAHWTDAIQTVPRRGYRFAGDVVRNAVPAQAKRRTIPRFFYGTAAAALALAFSLGLMHETARSQAQQFSAPAARLFAVGTYYWKQRTESGVQKSIHYFTAVIKTDPKNARGYAALAQAYAIAADYGYGSLKPKQSYARARTIARRAVAMDTNLAEAHAALGIAEDVAGSRTAAREQFYKAVQLDPNYATAHQWYGSALLEQGRPREALAELQKALQLDPVSVATLAWLSSAAYLSRDYAQAIAYARQTLEFAPQRRDAYFTLGLGYEALGNYRGAVEAYRGYAQRCAGCRFEAAALLAHAYARWGDYRRALQQLSLASHKRGMGAPDPGDLAVALVALNRRSDALAALKAATRGETATLGLDPRLDPIRRDPAFRKYFRAPA